MLIDGDSLFEVIIDALLEIVDDHISTDKTNEKSKTKQQIPDQPKEEET